MRHPVDSRWLAIVIAALAIVFIFGGRSYGQARAQRGSNALSGFGHVGATGVSQGQRLYTEGYRGSGAGDVASGNFAPGGAGGQGALPGGRYRPPSVDMFRPQQLGIHNALANPLNYGLARPMAMIGRDYTGRQSWARARGHRFGEGYRPGQVHMAVQAPQILLYQNAFLAPVRNATRGGRIRDGLTNRSLRNMPTADEMKPDDTAPGRSFADLMEWRLNAEIDKRLHDAWASFLAGRYQNAGTKFETLCRWKGYEAEATLGMLFSALATGQAQSSVALVRRLFPDVDTEAGSPSAGIFRPRANPFLAQIDLRALAAMPLNERPSSVAIGTTEEIESLGGLPQSVPWNERTLDELVNEWDRAATASKDVHIQATSVLLLWYAGDRARAQRQAERIRQEFRATPFRGIADDIREALETETPPEAQPIAAAQPASDR
jgi:hypothetical protein